jgi:hypothetical protein
VAERPKGSKAVAPTFPQRQQLVLRVSCWKKVNERVLSVIPMKIGVISNFNRTCRKADFTGRGKRKSVYRGLLAARSEEGFPVIHARFQRRGRRRLMRCLLAGRIIVCDMTIFSNSVPMLLPSDISAGTISFVSTSPGLMELMRILREPSSLARDSRRSGDAPARWSANKVHASSVS